MGQRTASFLQALTIEPLSPYSPKNNIAKMHVELKLSGSAEDSRRKFEVQSSDFNLYTGLKRYSDRYVTCNHSKSVPAEWGSCESGVQKYWGFCTSCSTWLQSTEVQSKNRKWRRELLAECTSPPRRELKIPPHPKILHCRTKPKGGNG